MMLSSTLCLRPVTSAPIFGALGRPAQAWFLSQIMAKHPKLAQELHDVNGIKPFTVSTLLDRYGHPLKAGDWLKQGQECWLRVTTIGEELSEAYLINVLRKLPKTVTFYKMDFRVDGFSLNSHEYQWAGQTTFAELAQESQHAASTREVRMEFVSPTAFRSNGNDVALPIPFQVFRSLWQKWNVSSPETMKLDELWPDFAGDCILISELTAVNTVHWSFAEGTRGAATGFTGTVGFSLLPRSKVLKKWQPYWEGADVVLQSLARFAFFCGVGHHTTIGMGQCRPLYVQPRVGQGKRQQSSTRRMNS